MKKRTVWYVGVGASVLMLVLAGCNSAGAGSGGGGGGGNGGGDGDSSELTVTGNTEYSPDGGDTVESASFEFTTSGLSTSGLAPSSTGNTVPVNGRLRAGDILLNLQGSYDPDSGDFNVIAVGVLANLKIEVTVSGVSNPSTGEITSGTTLATVTDTITEVTQTFRSESVGNGEDAGSPISDTTGTDESDPIDDGDKEFWEGVWGREARIYIDENGDPTTSETDYWVDLTYRVVATSTQYNIYGREDYNAALESFGEVDYEYYDTAVLAKTLSETSTELVAITYYPNDPVGDQYWKERIFLNADETIWGTYSYNDNGTPTDEDDDIESYGSIDDAETNLNSEYPVEWPFGENQGLTKVQ